MADEQMDRARFVEACSVLERAWEDIHTHSPLYSLMDKEGGGLTAQMSWADLLNLFPPADSPIALSFRSSKEYPWGAAVKIGKVTVIALLTEAEKRDAVVAGVAVAEEQDCDTMEEVA